MRGFFTLCAEFYFYILHYSKMQNCTMCDIMGYITGANLLCKLALVTLIVFRVFALCASTTKL